jgi:hypothetical protein
MKIHVTPSGALMALVMCMVHIQARSQDSLFYTNGSVIVGQVEEIGLDQIRYHTNSAGNQVLIVVDRRDLAGIKLKGGQAYTFGSTATEGPYSAAFLARKRSLSLDVLSPALDHVTVGYEQGIGHRVSLAVKAGYIGLWETDSYDDTFNSKGGLITAGVRFTLPYSTKRIPSARDMHPLAGWYLQPEVVFSAWTRTYYNHYYYDPYFGTYPATTTDDYTSAALMLTIGRQVLLGERFTFDIFGGFGYGAQWRDGKATNGGFDDPGRQNYAFSHAFIGNVSPLVVSGGLRFGYVF